MSTVSSRANSFKQPRGGFLKPASFQKYKIDNDIDVLNPEENISPSVIGTTVDYLTRFLIGIDKREAFSISLTGAQIAEQVCKKKFVNIAEKLINGISGFDDISIVNACKLVAFDIWVRDIFRAIDVKGYKDTEPDKETIQNIRILVKRSLAFFEIYGKPVKVRFTFEPQNCDIQANQTKLKTRSWSFGGYTSTVESGDGDFLTSDTMWDFKVSKSNPTNKHTLQLLMYWIMGQHSGQEVFKKINKLGIFNPRLNTVYLLKVDDIPDSIIQAVENDVICYK